MSLEKTSIDKRHLHHGESFVDAAKLKCRSQIANAYAKINLYCQNSVGIGDHPDIMDEIYNAAKDGAEAQDVLNFLESM
jgi:hypothetical protein